jgi:hypothetical protein
MTTEANDVVVEPVAAEPVVTAPATTIDPKAPVVPKAEPEAISYEETGDPKLDLALDFFGRHGLDADHQAIKAAITGDFSFLEAYLDEKDVKGWKSYVALAKEAHASAVKTVQEADAKVSEAVSKTLEQFGYSNEQWGEAIQWVRTESPEDVPEINKLLSSGPLGARAITAFILSNHREASGVEYAPQAKAVKDEAGANAGGQRQVVTPISKSDFGREAEKLARSLGPDYMSSKEYRVLRERAGIGRK